MKNLLSGKTFLFQGDSVTDAGRDRSKMQGTECLGDGYPKIFAEIYTTLFPSDNTVFVNRGVSGNKTSHLLERYEDDFRAVKPDYISIMIGINNTWRNFDSGEEEYTSAEVFEKEYEELLGRIKTDMPDAKIIIIEQFAFTQHPHRSTWQEDLDAKRDATRRLAFRYADYFVPMYDIMTQHTLTDFDMYELSADGVHPEYTGHALIASEMLRELGII